MENNIENIEVILYLVELLLDCFGKGFFFIYFVYMYEIYVYMFLYECRMCGSLYGCMYR